MKTTERPLTPELAVAPRRRVEWADSAKGMSIIGVCLMHVVTAIPGGTETSLGLLSSILDPLRMPLFFLVSGLFSHRILERTLGDLWYRRLWFLLVPYLVFTPIQAALRLQLDDKLSLENVIRAILFGDPGLWFLYCLMLYNVAAWFLRKQPAWVAIALSTVPMFIASVGGLMQEQSFRQALTWAPVFFIGLHCRKFFFALADNAFRPAPIIISAALFIASEYAHRVAYRTVFSEWDDTVAAVTVGTGLVRALAAIPFGIVVATWLSNTPLIGTVVEFLGRITLPIYVSHQAFLFFLLPEIPALINSDPELFGFLDTPIGATWYGLAVCFLAGAIFYTVGKIPVLRWVLYPPSLRRRETRTHERKTV
ncbi:acyltransferase family protein [Corynebacterium falsenii]|uniref:acyltransferase family protein n=1 Tax=Corynebacterium falsenii TaxID=108486 RepID=UPI001CCCEECB|nr:acyltransferase family protein [Corynebacterium falsenii]MDC7103695.1 acyltransferase family protein [Corynebacterium falsenii]UBI06369.1 acyltransferase family protein [Corynebacterium falsenii]